MVFQGCNLYRYLGSEKQDIACSKSTYHRFLGNEHYNWRRFITLLAAGIPAEYILMDTWFTNEPFIKRILGCGLDVIGMLKNNRQMYHFNGGLYNLCLIYTSPSPRDA